MASAPNFDDSPKISLLSKVSPLEPLNNLGSKIGLPHLWVKRDDEGGPGGGGNKLRKFERQMAKAIEQGADTLVLAGHPQSNAARAIAGTGARLGMRVVIPCRTLIPPKNEPMRDNGNKFLLELLGAELRELAENETFEEGTSRIVEELKGQNAKPYVLPFGASNVDGVLGYVECANEILTQCEMKFGGAPDIVVVACGSGGTMAGLVAGFAAANVDTRVQGFTILKPAEEAQETVLILANDTLARLGANSVKSTAFDIDARALGGGYGATTDASLAMIRQCAQTEGLFLDPVYTGKAMAGLANLAQENTNLEKARIVFVHTGGLPLLFAYQQAFGK